MKVTKTGENAYVVAIPDSVVIGYDKPIFEVAVEDDGILSWDTPDIDKMEMVNEVFNDAALQRYFEDHQDHLKDQAQVFYPALLARREVAESPTRAA